MHLFFVAVKGKVPTRLSRVPSKAQHGGRLLIMSSEREGETLQFLPEVLAVESPRPGGIR
jgi:hypothetical protein